MRLLPSATVIALLALPATAPLTAQTPPDYLVRQLSPSGEAASRVGGAWAIDPRGDWVAFAGDVEIAGAEAVYAVRRNGSDLHRLSPYGALGAITDVDFSPDGRFVIYEGDLEVDGRKEIWSVAPGGTAGAAVKLSGAVTGAGVSHFRVPKSGARLAYIAETAVGRQLWSVPFAGPSSSGVHLDPETVGDEYLQAFEFCPDGAAVVVQLIDNTAQSARIFTVPIGGPAASATLLAASEPGGCLPVFADFTPDSSRLVFASLCPPSFAMTQLWSVPAAGPAAAAVSLAGSFAAGGSLQELAYSPDSQWLVFSADRLVDERVELFSVPAAGPAAAIVRLNPSLVTNGDVKSGFRISPDSTRVAYIADQASDERFFPYTVPIAGPSSSAVSLYQGPLAVSADALDLAFTPDSSKVIFRFDLLVDGRLDLFFAPADGSAAQARITNRGSNPGPERSVAFRWYVHPDGERVIYQYDEAALLDERGIGEQRILDPYSVSDLRLNGPPVLGGKVSYFELYPDGAGLVYRADEDQDEKFELFTVDTRIFGDGFEGGDSAAWGDLP